MARMQFDDIYTRVENITNISNQRNLIKEAIQWGLDDLTSADLAYLMSEGFFTTVAPYETGTVDVTNGSKTVTGNSTVFTAAMVGRKIRVNSENAYYRIAAFVSATEITLEAPYAGDTDTTLTYSIYKDEYRLAPDVDVYKLLRQIEQGISLGSLEATAFDIIDPTPQGEGTPRFEILIGTKLDTYTTGDVSGSLSGTTLTGASTAWNSVEGLAKGSRITIASDTYTVKSVDSDTQITIYETLIAAASNAAYTIHLDNYIVQLSDIPDAAENIYYRYQRVPYPIVNDTDIPDLPEKYQHLLVLAGMMWAWETKDKKESQRIAQMFEIRKNQMWARLSNVSTSRIYRRKSMDIRQGINLKGQPLPGPNRGFPIEI